MTLKRVNISLGDLTNPGDDWDDFEDQSKIISSPQFIITK